MDAYVASQIAFSSLKVILYEPILPFKTCPRLSMANDRCDSDRIPLVVAFAMRNELLELWQQNRLRERRGKLRGVERQSCHQRAARTISLHCRLCLSHRTSP